MQRVHKPVLGIDLMGADTPAENLLSAVLKLAQKSDAHFVLFGTADLFAKNSCPPSVTSVTVSEVIGMEDDPLHAVRRKQDSSLCVGMKKLAAGELTAFVSAGNTGALMASASLMLPLLNGIDKPALLTPIPTRKGEMAVLDMGANIICTATNLVQFALMGIAYQKCRGTSHPKVGLLNIGTEAKKGTPLLREAYQLLEEKFGSTFIGNIEGNQAFQGLADVLVTDGFAGNIFLKTAEGIAAVILEELGRSPEFAGALQTLHTRLTYAEYPGALLCGVDGIVMKCHGDADPKTFCQTIEGALRLASHNLIDKIKSHLLLSGKYA
jgi:glycerol-3-phosphate acyltransferase PlsX